MLSGTIRLAKSLDYETIQVIRGIVSMLMMVMFVFDDVDDARCRSLR